MKLTLIGEVEKKNSIEMALDKKTKSTLQDLFFNSPVLFTIDRKEKKMMIKLTG